MNAVDLAPGIAAIEAQMVDTCVITRVRPGTGDDTLDPVTLGLTSPAGAQVYSGKCLLAGGGGGGVEEIGHGQDEVDTYRLLIPLAAAGVVERGDRVAVTSARWQQQLTARQFRVRMETTRTVAVCRRIQVEARE